MHATLLKPRVDRFLASASIAVIGVSTHKQEAANLNYSKLKEAGYTVFAVNPKYEEYDGDACYHHISALNGMVEAVLIFTPPHVTLQVAKECYLEGIKNIWVHRGLGNGSHSDEATDFFRDKTDVNFIDGGCPMMFIRNADWFHKGVRKVMEWTGGLQ